MREFGWTEKQLLEEVTIEKMQQIAYIYEMESKREKSQSHSSSMPSISSKSMRKMR